MGRFVRLGEHMLLESSNSLLNIWSFLQEGFQSVDVPPQPLIFKLKQKNIN
jgi:hypothetical protein